MGFGCAFPGVAAAACLRLGLNAVAARTDTDDFSGVEDGCAALAALGEAGWVMELIDEAGASVVLESAVLVAFADFVFDLWADVASGAAAVVVECHGFYLSVVAFVELRHRSALVPAWRLRSASAGPHKHESNMEDWALSHSEGSRSLGNSGDSPIRYFAFRAASFSS